MPLHYDDLDPKTRRLSLAELQRDAESGTLRTSERLRPDDAPSYRKLLEDAIKYYDDGWLEQQAADMLVDYEIRRTPSGGQTTARLPQNAARLLAEADFNRYYMRGVCVRALDEGVGEVEIYRARLSVEPREESARHEGERIAADRLLDELREGRTPETAPLGLPGSGLSIRLPDD